MLNELAVARAEAEAERLSDHARELAEALEAESGAQQEQLAQARADAERQSARRWRWRSPGRTCAARVGPQAQKQGVAVAR